MVEVSLPEEKKMMSGRSGDRPGGGAAKRVEIPIRQLENGLLVAFMGIQSYRCWTPIIELQYGDDEADDTEGAAGLDMVLHHWPSDRQHLGARGCQRPNPGP